MIRALILLIFASFALNIFLTFLGAPYFFCFGASLLLGIAWPTRI